MNKTLSNYTVNMVDIQTYEMCHTKSLTCHKYMFGFSLTDKRGIDSRLASAQTALMLQEETIRRNERERKVMADKINSLERSLAAADTEKRQQEVSNC